MEVLAASEVLGRYLLCEPLCSVNLDVERVGPETSAGKVEEGRMVGRGSVRLYLGAAPLVEPRNDDVERVADGGVVGDRDGEFGKGGGENERRARPPQGRRASRARRERARAVVPRAQGEL